MKPRWNVEAQMAAAGFVVVNTAQYDYRKRRALLPANPGKVKEFQALSDLSKEIVMKLVLHFSTRLSVEPCAEWRVERPVLWKEVAPIVEGTKIRRAMAERLVKEVWKVWRYDQAGARNCHAHQAFGAIGTAKIMCRDFPVFYTKTDFKLTFDPAEDGAKFACGAYLKDAQGGRIWVPLLLDRKTVKRIKAGELDPREIVLRKRCIGKGEAETLRKRFAWAGASKWIVPIEKTVGVHAMWTAHIHCRAERPKEAEKVSSGTEGRTGEVARESRRFSAPTGLSMQGTQEQVRQAWAGRMDRRLLTEVLPPGLGSRYLLACGGEELRTTILKQARAHCPTPRSMAAFRSAVDALLS